ncbi:erad-associated e3 ubiquitin-protein ligase doa10 [Acrodontium crateriforme]|uniref:RING-type E3 ubiquitin transferase n=1 Tax=Acrodontium crateriforme TaxID=150365 RepID=A0AAQ3REB9_9PEZI|nr:erad-associated e3 ubiquitin-protein ligase doa10 [Acrodontium crateriforme]
MDPPTFGNSDLFWPFDTNNPDVVNASRSLEKDMSSLEPVQSLPDGDAASDRAETCRICRSEATQDEPLFYPCKCSGSIKYVHQECLMEWLSHSQKKYCELCKTPFRFTKLYDAGMPQALPWSVFFQRAFIHATLTLLSAVRGMLVATVWMVILPWLVRWAWRWMFWIADAGWVRDAFISKLNRAHQELQAAATNQTGLTESFSHAFQGLLHGGYLPNGSAVEPLALSIAKEMLSSLNIGHYFTTQKSSSNGSVYGSLSTSPQADVSILSSWTYIAELTSNPGLNRIILDVFEGQLITCVVITGFILVFLIREWVVQQQPLANLEADNADLIQQLDAAAIAMRAQEERTNRQVEQLQDDNFHASNAILQLQRDIREDGEDHDLDELDPSNEFCGWLALQELLDMGSAALTSDEEYLRARFQMLANRVLMEVRMAHRAGANLADLGFKIKSKMRAYSPYASRRWRRVFRHELYQIARGIEPERLALAQPFLRRIEIDLEDQPAMFEQHEGNIEESLRPQELEMLVFLQMVSTEDSSIAVANGSSEMETLAFSHSDANPDEAKTREPHTSPILSKPLPVAKSNTDDIPIANAGPEAKINIKRSGNGKIRPVPPPTPQKFLTEDELRERLEQDVATAGLQNEIQADDAATGRETEGTEATHNHTLASSSQQEPQQTDDSQYKGDGLGGHLANMLLEDLGLDEASQRQSPRANEINHTVEPGSAEVEPADEVPRPTEASPPHTRLQRLFDWFWGDIPFNQSLPEPVPAPPEERLNGDNAAPFIQPAAPAVAPGQLPAINGAPLIHDPEVLAAAAEAGLDAEAAEDAEDLEGIMELIGLQGPLIGLFQTSTFCVVLVAGTIFGAVGLPYVLGKIALPFLSSPMYFIVKMPLQMASFVADFVIDLSLVVCGWSVFALALGWESAFGAIEAWLPKIGGISIGEWIANLAVNTASASATRLQGLFVTSGIGPNWAFLQGSMLAHASLKELQNEVEAILQFSGNAITAVVDTISSGSVSLMCKRAISVLAETPEIQAKIRAGLLERYTKPLVESLSSLRTGALTFHTAEVPLDPSLVFWSSTDRSITVMTGYLALAAVAAIYVAMDTPISFSDSSQRIEKYIRDTLRQAGGVLKVILIISIEMLVFPLYCGLLLDIAFMPLFQGSSLSTRWAFAASRPYTFCFIHWFVGTCYMFHFALFVGMCRKILRKGLLWFIRDPDDPTFHPVRDVLERGVLTQLRKIAFSALVYGALVILCLGGVIWTIGHAFEGIFPIHWVSTEPVLEFPMDLLLYNAVTPIMFRLVKPSDAVNSMYAWWFRRCARMLRLSHFLFDDRRLEEEGKTIRKTWTSFFLVRKASDENLTSLDGTATATTIEDTTEVYFLRDGKYVLTPCSDQYRPPKPGEAFLHSDDDDVYIADKNGKKNDHFAKAYVPPLFRVRITLFMVCLWIFSAFIGLSVTLLPLVVGRQLFAKMVPNDVRVNDIYAYSVGAYLLGGLIFIGFRVRDYACRLQNLSGNQHSVNMTSWVQSIKRLTVQTLKCMYVYGFVGLVLPTLFLLTMQFYVAIPLHTYAASFAKGVADLEQHQNSTLSTLANPTVTNATASRTIFDNSIDYPSHTIHVLQDFCLGLLYVRIGGRMMVQPAASRGAEAFRRITANGYLNPDARLATRYLVAPALILAATILLVPPMIAKLVFMQLSLIAPLGPVIDGAVRTKLYRYSYPLAASWLVIAICAVGLMKATTRWRTVIRDEVYLVGERLHNFGEKKPPEGSRSVRRKDALR